MNRPSGKQFILDMISYIEENILILLRICDSF